MIEENGETTVFFGNKKFFAHFLRVSGGPVGEPRRVRSERREALRETREKKREKRQKAKRKAVRRLPDDLESREVLFYVVVFPFFSFLSLFFSFAFFFFVAFFWFRLILDSRAENVGLEIDGRRRGGLPWH